MLTFATFSGGRRFSPLLALLPPGAGAASISNKTYKKTYYINEY